MILLTGGTGLLGSHLKKLLPNDLFAPTRQMLDITSKESIKNLHVSWENIHLIVHCAAFTDLVKSEQTPGTCYNVNVGGTSNLAKLKIPMVYISTEYVFDGEEGFYNEDDKPEPKNYYGLTKLWGEQEARRTRSVIIRCLFKSRPFKHDFACYNQFTTGDYVDKIAPEIALAIRNFDKLPETIHIGFNKKSMFELARVTKPEIKPISYQSITAVRLPKDTSLDTTRWRKIKELLHD